MRNVELCSAAAPESPSTRRLSGETTVRNNASSLRRVVKSVATGPNFSSRSSLSGGGAETSGDNRYARFRAGTSRKIFGLTSCRSMTVLQEVAKNNVRRIVRTEVVDICLMAIFVLRDR